MSYSEFLELLKKESCNKNTGSSVAYLYYMYNKDFLGILGDMAEGISGGSEYYGYNFPDVYDDPSEDGFFEEGIQFWVNDTISVISNNIFLRYLKIVCEEYKKNNKNEIDIVNQLYEKISQKLK